MLSRKYTLSRYTCLNICNLDWPKKLEYLNIIWRSSFHKPLQTDNQVVRRYAELCGLWRSRLAAFLASPTNSLFLCEGLKIHNKIVSYWLRENASISKNCAIRLSFLFYVTHYFAPPNSISNCWMSIDFALQLMIYRTDCLHKLCRKCVWNTEQCRIQKGRLVTKAEATWMISEGQTQWWQWRRTTQIGQEDVEGCASCWQKEEEAGVERRGRGRVWWGEWWRGNGIEEIM